MQRISDSHTSRWLNKLVFALAVTLSAGYSKVLAITAWGELPLQSPFYWSVHVLGIWLRPNIFGIGRWRISVMWSRVMNVPFPLMRYAGLCALHNVPGRRIWRIVWFPTSLAVLRSWYEEWSTVIKRSLWLFGIPQPGVLLIARLISIVSYNHIYTPGGSSYTKLALLTQVTFIFNTTMLLPIALVPPLLLCKNLA